MKTLGLMTGVERRHIRDRGCAICHESRGVQAAHIKARKEGGPGTIDNVMPLCPTHHWCYDHDLLSINEWWALLKNQFGIDLWLLPNFKEIVDGLVSLHQVLVPAGTLEPHVGLH